MASNLNIPFQGEFYMNINRLLVGFLVLLLVAPCVMAKPNNEKAVASFNSTYISTVTDGYLFQFNDTSTGDHINNWLWKVTSINQTTFVRDPITFKAISYDAIPGTMKVFSHNQNPTYIFPANEYYLVELKITNGGKNNSYAVIM